MAKRLSITAFCRLSVLGDTSYGECCVDEVSAQHVDADGMVHFGHACMTPVDRMEVLHVFVELEVDLLTLFRQVEAARIEAKRIFVFYDVGYHKAFKGTCNSREATSIV